MTGLIGLGSITPSSANTRSEGNRRYLRTEYLNGQVFFTVAMQPKKIRCSACNCRKVIRRGTAERRFRSLPIGKKTVGIVLAIQRGLNGVGPKAPG
jgi:hypothetical protein